MRKKTGLVAVICMAFQFPMFGALRKSKKMVIIHREVWSSD